MFGINSTPYEVFAKNFLRSVTFSAFYQETASCTELREQFKKLFSDIMPKAEEANGAKFELNNGTFVQDNRYDAKQLVLRSSDMQKSFTLTNDSCVYDVSGSMYKNSEELNSHIKKASSFLETCGIRDFTNIVLRKQNILQFNIQSNDQRPAPLFGPLTQIISNRLLLSFGSLEDISNYTRQSMQTMQLEDSGYQLTLRYGYQIINKEDNGKKADGLIILDIEMSHRNVKIENLESELHKFHTELYNAFIWSLSDNAIRILKNGQL